MTADDQRTGQVVLVCGSRDYSDQQAMFETLDRIHAESPIAVIVNGAMAGADAMSSYWAYSRKVNTEAVGAQWGDLGGSAGPARNKKMLDMHNPDQVVAFCTTTLSRSRGTRNCVGQATKRGVPVVVVQTED